MSAPFGQPAYADLVQQIADLHTAVAKPITLDDLPLADLRKQLIDNGEPLDLSVLALPGQSIDFGQDGLQVRSGSGTLTFTAAATSANLTVPHGLTGGKVPRVFPSPYSGVAWCLIQVVSVDATNIVFQGRDADATVRTGTNNFDWLAIG